MNIKTITICGKEVELLYCAATETGYESISGRSCEVFIPEITQDKKGNTKPLMHATTRDYIQLAVAAIIAASTFRGQEAPVTANDILYSASSKEVTNLITAVIELRNAWYLMPSVVKKDDGDAPDQPEEKDQEEKPKN